MQVNSAQQHKLSDQHYEDCFPPIEQTLQIIQNILWNRLQSVPKPLRFLYNVLPELHVIDRPFDLISHLHRSTLVCKTLRKRRAVN